ncbi:MAG TPA: LysO family transporter [Tepiditoga sp.]|nr:LysO family transporter [Thermotogota bacterium]HOO74411.1 LysO family transporter [Tepiditoga sp.]
MLLMILTAFIVGLFLGTTGKLKFVRKFKPVTVITVLLLFFMGYEIGNDDTLISKLPEIGFKALLIAVFSVMGSIIFTAFYEKLLKRSDKK